jgi:KDO2-lipid IV(A) lauroyltransferase
MKYKTKHVVEYFALRVFVSLIRIVPYRAALLAGWSVAWIGHRLVRFRADEARRRIRSVLGDRLSEARVSMVAWVSWRNFIFAMIDLIRLNQVNEQWLKAHVQNYDEFHQAFESSSLKKGRGAIMACPHIGSSEMGGAAMQALGVPIFFITGKQKNPLVDRYLNEMRRSTGIATIERGSSLLKTVIRRLRQGEVLGFQPDVRSATEGVRIRFLGQEANVVGGMALFAKMSDVPIFTSVTRRLNWTKHTFHLYPAVQPDAGIEKEPDWQRMTQEVFTVIEQEILDHPEQWYWYNKRWILDPLETPAGPATVPDSANASSPSPAL